MQHLEGGIVQAIYVREGDTVEEGDLLYEIDALAVTSNRDQLALQRAAYLANTERITALLSGETELEFETDDTWNVADIQADSIRREQLNLFREQRQTLNSQIDLRRQRIQSMRVGAQQRELQIDAIDESIVALDEELALTRRLVEEQLAPATDALRLTREKSRLSSEKADQEKQRLEIGSQIMEIEKEIFQIESEFRERLSTELVETRNEIAKADEQLKAIEDAVYRSRVLAPSSGKVMNVMFTTIGGVVKPGEPMLEIVPEDAGNWATVQILPNDRETISEGMDVRVRLSGFQSWLTDDIRGTVTNVSADLKQVPEANISYYEARILLNDEDLQSSNLPPLQPGMPVSAFVASGQEKTLAEYLVEPIAAHIRKGLASG